MKCPLCHAKVELIRAEDRTQVRYCSSPKCDWQHPPAETPIAHNTTSAVVREEKKVNGTTGEQR